MFSLVLDFLLFSDDLIIVSCNVSVIVPIVQRLVHLFRCLHLNIYFYLTVKSIKKVSHLFIYFFLLSNLKRLFLTWCVNLSEGKALRFSIWRKSRHRHSWRMNNEGFIAILMEMIRRMVAEGRQTPKEGWLGLKAAALCGLEWRALLTRGTYEGWAGVLASASKMSWLKIALGENREMPVKPGLAAGTVTVKLSSLLFIDQHRSIACMHNQMQCGFNQLWELLINIRKYLTKQIFQSAKGALGMRT